MVSLGMFNWGSKHYQRFISDNNTKTREIYRALKSQDKSGKFQLE